LIVKIRDYSAPDAKATMAIPYTPAQYGTPLKVHKPKFLLWDNCEQYDLNSYIDAFFEGVGSHEKGAEIWNQSFDQSL